jgi:biotin synthase
LLWKNDMCTQKYQEIAGLYKWPLFELVAKAYAIHRQHFEELQMELCSLVSLKTGGCSEDCRYCAQSTHHSANIMLGGLLDVDTVLEKARAAKKQGARRLCMGAAWRHPLNSAFEKVLDIIRRVKAMGIETCVTLGMVTEAQALALKSAGLDVYNHNLETSPEYYAQVVKTHYFQDRIRTIENIRKAGIKVCCGGILGMGESRQDRIQFLCQLALLSIPPESIPINKFIPIPGTPLERIESMDNFEFIKTIAIARTLFPHSMIRLGAGRASMFDEMQAWCFMAGANSIFYGDQLLTAPNANREHDIRLLEKLAIQRM